MTTYKICIYNELLLWRCRLVACITIVMTYIHVEMDERYMSFGGRFMCPSAAVFRLIRFL